MEHLILSLLNHYSWINSSGGRLVGGRVPRQDMVMNCLVVLAKGKSCLSYKDQSQRLNREMRHDISRDRETLSQQNTILSEINKNNIASNTRNPEDQCSSPSYVISSTSLSVHLICTVSTLQASQVIYSAHPLRAALQKQNKCSASVPWFSLLTRKDDNFMIGLGVIITSVHHHVLLPAAGKFYKGNYIFHCNSFVLQIW